MALLKTHIANPVRNGTSILENMSNRWEPALAEGEAGRNITKRWKQYLASPARKKAVICHLVT